MKKINELVELVEYWAIDKGINKAESLFPQFCKVSEEVGEIAECISKGKLDELKGEIGDGVITLIILSLQANIDFRDAISTAFEKIKNRKGKTVNGVFRKEKTF